MLLTVTQKLLEGFGTSCIIFIVTLLALPALGFCRKSGLINRLKKPRYMMPGLFYV